MTSLTCVAAFSEVGGYNELIRKYFESYPSENFTAYDENNQSCAVIRSDAMHLLRSIDPSKSDLPWTVRTNGNVFS